MQWHCLSLSRSTAFLLHLFSLTVHVIICPIETRWIDAGAPSRQKMNALRPCDAKDSWSRPKAHKSETGEQNDESSKKIWLYKCHTLQEVKRKKRPPLAAMIFLAPCLRLVASISMHDMRNQMALRADAILERLLSNLRRNARLALGRMDVAAVRAAHVASWVVVTDGIP